MTNLLLAAGLWMAAVAGFSTLRQRGLRWFDGRPLLTVSSAGVIAATSLAQLTLAPDLLQVLMRTAPHVVAREPWRLATSLLVQDGGWAGFAFNLVSLLIIGSLAERLLGRLRWVIVGSVAVAATQAVALTWQPIGAGNSILNFGLAGGLAAACLMSHRSRTALLPAAVALGCFVALLVARDLHGVAGVTGGLVECAAVLIGRRPAPRAADAAIVKPRA